MFSFIKQLSGRKPQVAPLQSILGPPLHNDIDTIFNPLSAAGKI